MSKKLTRFMACWDIETYKELSVLAFLFALGLFSVAFVIYVMIFHADPRS